MAAIARALMSNPRLLLCDEISLGLAPIVVRDIYARLPAIVAEGLSLIVVEQDIAQALKAARQVYCLQEGRIALQGAARELTRERSRPRISGCDGDGMAQRHPAGRADRRALRHVRRRPVADLRRHAAGQHRAWRPDRAGGLCSADGDAGARRRSAHLAAAGDADHGGDRLRAATRAAQSHARRRPAAAAAGDLRPLHHHPERAAGTVHRRQPQAAGGRDRNPNLPGDAGRLGRRAAAHPIRRRGGRDRRRCRRCSTAPRSAAPSAPPPTTRRWRN